MDQLIIAALIFAALGAVTFVALYSRAGWRTSSVGRAIMALMVALILFLSVGFVRTFGIAEEYIDWVRLIAYSSVGVIIWRLVWLLLRTQRQDRKARR